jgi:hypothetical protein
MKDNSPVYWKMRNGNLINVDDMDNNHVRNAFKMLLRNIQKLQQNNSKSVTKFKLKGDIAQDFNNSQTCPNCGEEHLGEYCCGFDACEIDIY